MWLWRHGVRSVWTVRDVRVQLCHVNATVWRSGDFKIWFMHMWGHAMQSIRLGLSAGISFWDRIWGLLNSESLTLLCEKVMIVRDEMARWCHGNVPVWRQDVINIPRAINGNNIWMSNLVIQALWCLWRHCELTCSTMWAINSSATFPDKLRIPWIRVFYGIRTQWWTSSGMEIVIRHFKGAKWMIGVHLD